MVKTKEIFKENLRKILQDSGKSLTEAAEDCGISLSYMNQLVSGKKSFSGETIDKLAKGLKISRYELFITEDEHNDLSTKELTDSNDSLKELLSIINNLGDSGIKSLVFAAKGIEQLRQNQSAQRPEKSEK